MNNKIEFTLKEIKMNNLKNFIEKSKKKSNFTITGYKDSEKSLELPNQKIKHISTSEPFWVNLTEDDPFKKDDWVQMHWVTIIMSECEFTVRERC